MAMTKAERAEMDSLRRLVALRRSDSIPATIDVEEARKGMGWRDPSTAWWFNAHTTTVGAGCFTSNSHSRRGTETTDSQTAGGPWFQTKRDALIALRRAVEEQCAERLFRIDEQIAAEPTP